MNVRFGICADLHSDYIHDSVERMEKFIRECKEKKVDFCVDLGDFCAPNSENIEHKEKILDMVKTCGLPFYHTYGNHDMDNNSKKEVADLLGEEKVCCSFDMGGVHFIIADACFFQENGCCIPYDHGNYKNAAPDAKVPVLPPSEQSRIRNEMNKADFPTVIFSHQSLIESRTGIRNASDFRRCISDTKSKLLMAICGHEHVDRLEQKDGTYYYCLNSMSYYWAGENYDHTTYGEDVESKYFRLRYVFPYRDPLYAIIEITDSAIKINGRESEIVGALPESMNFTKKGLTEPVTASVISRDLKIN